MMGALGLLVVGLLAMLAEGAATSFVPSWLCPDLPLLLVIGLALLFDNWGIVNLKTSDLVPLVIVAVGIGTIVIALSRVVPGRGESPSSNKPETR